MFGPLKQKTRDFIAAIVEKALQEQTEQMRSGPAAKAALRHLYGFYQSETAAGRCRSLADTGLRVYSQFEEDGLLLYIFAAIGTETRCFVDIGSADGINSNCANLAINFGWHGLFIDGDGEQIRRGRSFYENHPDTRAWPPQFVEALVCRENVNDVIQQAGISGPVDLLSIDINGNDYWIWDALEVIEPRVVIIETHVEFGMQSIVVPYDRNYVYPGKHPQYHGASPVAMQKLAERKGYRLVGAGQYGFNMIFVRSGVGEDVLPAVPVESVLRHPRNEERRKLFEPIRDWPYETV